VLNFYHRIFEYFEVGPTTISQRTIIGLYLLVTSIILWHLQNVLTLAVCMCCNECCIIGIINGNIHTCGLTVAVTQ